MSGWQEERHNEITILIAHGEAGAREQARRALAGAGYRLRETADARALLATLEAAPPDLLLLDPALPAPDGAPLLPRLQLLPQRATMALLALAPAHRAADLLAQGADQVLPAPLLPHSLATAVAALLRLKLAERAARELAARRAREQLALARAARRLAAAADLAATCAALAEAARADLGFDRAALALYDPAAQALRGRLTTTPDGQLAPAPALPALPLGPGAPLRDLPPFQALFQEGRDTVFLPDAQGRAPAYLRPFLDGPVRAALLAALRTPQGPLGLLVVDNLPSGRPLGPEDAAALAALAAQGALALQRARLAEALAARAREAEAVAQLGTALAAAPDPRAAYPRLLAAAAPLLPADHHCLLVSDGAWCRIAASIGSSLPERSPVIDLLGPCGAALTAGGGAIRLDDSAADDLWSDLPLWVGEHRIASMLIVPLMHADRLLGALVCGSFTHGAFAHDAAQLAGRLAPHMAAAIQAAAQQEELEDLRRAGAAAMRQRGGGIVMHLDDAELAEDLLLLAQAEAGKLALNAGIHAMTDLVTQALARAGRRHQRAVSCGGPADLRALADPRCATWTLAALLDNAARYSPDGTPIELTWALEAHHAVCRVRDAGPGIPPGEQEDLFKRLRHAARTDAGIGMGLYLGRRLAAAQGGSLILEATGGGGSTFALRLPLAPD